MMSVDMAEVERLVGEFERSISEPCNDPKQAASEYLTARRALLDHGNGRTPAVDGLVEACEKLKRNARHMNSLGTEWKVSGDDLAELETALSAVKTKGGGSRYGR